MGFINFNYFSELAEPSADSWFDKSFPTLIGVIVGFGLNRLLEHFKERKSIKLAGEDFLNELNLLKEPLQKQIEAIKSVVDVLKRSNKTFSMNIAITLPLDHERFNAKERLFVYKYFKNKYKKDASRKIVNQLYGIVKIVEAERNRIQDFFEKYIEGEKAEVKIFHAAISKMGRIFSSLLDEVEKGGGKIENDKFLFEVYQILIPVYQGNEQIGLPEAVETICKPIAEIISRNRFDDRHHKLTEQSQICFDCFHRHKSLNSTLEFQLTQINISLEGLLKQLNEKLNELDK